MAENNQSVNKIDHLVSKLDNTVQSILYTNQNKYQSVFYLDFHKESPKIINKGESDLERQEFIDCTNGLWVIAPESAKKVGHPAPFPEELAKRCIKMHSYKEAVVLDPFNGAGTTCKVANDLGRNWIGFDITQEYCDIALNRIYGKKGISNCAARQKLLI